MVSFVGFYLQGLHFEGVIAFEELLQPLQHVLRLGQVESSISHRAL